MCHVLYSPRKAVLTVKQKELSIWLRVVLGVSAAFILFLSLLLMPKLGQHAVENYPELGYLYWPCLVFFWVTAALVLVFLALVWKIAVEIGRDNSFCYENAKRLRICSNLALCDVILYLIGGCVLGAMNLLQPSLIIAGVVICSIGAAIAVCCAALSHLTRKAADMQSENDLTV